MDVSEMPTFSPLPPIGTAAQPLERQLNTFRNDIAELAVSTESAANRIALVLHRLNSRDETRWLSSNDPCFQQPELAASMPNYSISRYCHRSCSHLAPTAPAEICNGSNVESIFFPSLDYGSTQKQQEEIATAKRSSSVTAEDYCRATYEQSRTFLSVIASLKVEPMRTHQSEAVEERILVLTQQIKATTSADICYLIARQLVAYLHFFKVGDRVRRFIHEQTRSIPQICDAWGNGPGSLVEEALAQCCLHQEANDPIFDGIVFLAFVHFGIFDAAVARKEKLDEVAPPKKSGFAKLLERGAMLKLISKQVRSKAAFASDSKVTKEMPRRNALSVEILIAVAELCLRGIFRATVLCDLLALFALGIVEQNVSKSTSDMELLHAFLRDGLLPRCTAIRCKLGDADPIGDVLRILKVMDQLHEHKMAVPPIGDVHVDSTSSLRTGDEEWISLERCPSLTVPDWYQRPQTQSGFFPPTLGDFHVSGSGPERQANMLHIFDSYDVASSGSS